MPITILKPAPPITSTQQWRPENDTGLDVDSEGDVDMDDSRLSKQSKSSKHLVTPGELVTDDPQWMR
jgi:exosome complex component RRP4